MPLFVRAGAIIPVGPAIEYHRPEARRSDHALASSPADDGSFDLYEDDGVS